MMRSATSLARVAPAARRSSATAPAREKRSVSLRRMMASIGPRCWSNRSAQHDLQACEQALRREGFAQHECRTTRGGAFEHVAFCPRRHQDDRHMRCIATEPVSKRDTVHAWHLDIHDKACETMQVSSGQEGFGRAERGGGVSRRTEETRRCRANGFIVIDDTDLFLHSAHEAKSDATHHQKELYERVIGQHGCRRELQVARHANQVRERARAHLAHGLSAMDLDGDLAQFEHTSHLLVHLACGDEGHDLALARSQRCKTFSDLVRFPVLVPARAILLDRNADRVQYVLVAKGLGQEVDRAGLHSAYGHGNVAVPRDEHTGTWMFCCARRSWKSSPEMPCNRMSSTRHDGKSGRGAARKSC